MSVIPAKKIERNRNKLDGRHHAYAPPAGQTPDGEDVGCFSTGGGT
jgi:hypothetical protein